MVLTMSLSLVVVHIRKDQNKVLVLDLVVLDPVILDSQVLMSMLY